MKNIPIIAVFFSVSFNAFSMNQTRECIVFIGNPGVGKSTLVNSIVGKRVFESGLSATGITKLCQSYEYDGCLYIDTPGLADTKIRHQAAEEIEKALKKNGKYKIFFVITLEAGRIKPEDLNTINRVMESIKNPNKGFNIIINKVTKKEKQEVLEADLEYENFCAQINSQAHKTTSICYVERDRDLEDNDAEFISIDERIKKFFHEESKGFNLKENQVGKINPENAEELKRKAKEEEDRLRCELDRQRRCDDEMRRQIEEQRARLAELQRQKDAIMCPCCRARFGLN